MRDCIYFARHKVQKDLDKLATRARDNKMKFNEGKHKVLQIAKKEANAKYRTSAKWLDNSTAEKDLEVRIDHKLNMSQR